MGSVKRGERAKLRGWGTRVWHSEAQSVLPLPEGGGAHTRAHEGEGGAISGRFRGGRTAAHGGGSGGKGQGVGQVTESVVDKMVYGAASHGEMQAVADVVGEIEEDVREVWMVVDAEADMASLNRLASRPLHEALGTGLSSQVYAIWHGLEMKKVPLVIHLVKQESHRAGVGNHEAYGAAQAVDKEREPEWRVPESKEHLNLVHIPPRVGEEEKARWVVEEDRGKPELRVYPQPVHMLAQVRGGPEVVELNEYLEGKVGQRVHYPNVLRPESLPKRLQTRRLQAVTGQVPVRETIMRWYRHKDMDLPEEYMRCHCGQGQETYEHFMRCAVYKGIEERLVRDQDVPLLKKGARGRSAVERELGKEGRGVKGVGGGGNGDRAQGSGVIPCAAQCHTSLTHSQASHRQCGQRWPACRRAQPRGPPRWRPRGRLRTCRCPRLRRARRR